MERPSFDTLELQFDGQVATVSLNRPDKANSMNAAMWAELQTCFEWLDSEPSVRVVVVTSGFVAPAHAAVSTAAALTDRSAYTNASAGSLKYRVCPST